MMAALLVKKSAQGWIDRKQRSVLQTCCKGAGADCITRMTFQDLGETRSHEALVAKQIQFVANVTGGCFSPAFKLD